MVVGYVIVWYHSSVPILSLDGSCKLRLKKKFHREIKCGVLEGTESAP
jgi:hypothetical protein